MKNGYVVDYQSPPPIGTRIKTRSRTYCLEEVQRYCRKSDGIMSFILHWRDGHGDRYTSGLRSRGMSKACPK